MEFTRELLTELKRKGYTHIYSRGIQNENDENDNDFILVPLKPNDPRIKYEETDFNIQEIDSSDIQDMVHGDPFINFVIELPE